MRPLDGMRLLVVEDEFFLATELVAALEQAGAAVVGPCSTLDDALDRMEAETIHAAVVDYVLTDGDAVPVADALRLRGIPFVFATGLDTYVLPHAYAGVPVVQKPTPLDELVERLAEAARGMLQAMSTH